MATKNKSWLWASAGIGLIVALRAFAREQNKYSFQNKVVVITGGSRGLGLVLARQLAAEGALLAICSRTEDQLKKAEQELTAKGAEVLALPCDVTNRIQAEQFIERVLKYYGRIDVLINNAGTIQAGPLADMTLTDFEEAMNTHFWAPLYTMWATVPHMKERSQGRIVNIASVGGKVSIPHLVPYSASKFALVGLSNGFRQELKKDGILVTTVNPGLTRTGSNLNIKVKGQSEKEYAWFTTAGASLLISSSVEKTARKIINACRYGEAEVLTNVPAKILAFANQILPELTSDALSLTNKILPEESGNEINSWGYENESDLIPEHLRDRAARAARENNEL
ncbi:SDR family NAD(P)-dependent oxidoreductase [Adhaeribacter pallidiroseus]|uniref:Dehydrogenase/reductase SDR family member 7B n=1 Tax=Adhaeribacter pallidiroseus TaxID=2072847 RepID=A0A369QRY9_9BACT|nr:SDR family oxidoreductase [Adhaeribacter pallidiroseus]RDC66425.1 Dehydrogenase/reductase SDR family member 7B [Adhaeribacter pallidiroseus]